MSLEALINNNPTAVLTLIGVVFGVVVTATYNLLSKWMEYRNNIKIKRLDVAIELEKKYLIEPVVSFIVKDLKSMQKVYAKVLTPKGDGRELTVDNEHVFELSSVQARINGLSDTELIEKFNEFSRARISIGTSVSDRKREDAYQQLGAAIKLAGDILNLLFKKLRNIAN